MADSTSTTEENAGLVRQLGLFDSIMMMTGIVIGSGIFLTTGIIAQALPSTVLILLVWIAGGLLTLAGALTFAELGAAMPEAGGHYVYLKEAYGHLCGFLFGWILFLVAMGGSIAALGVGFAEYFGYFFPALSTQKIILSSEVNIFNHIYHYSLSMGQLVAIFVIVMLSTFNYVGVVFGKTIQNILTVTKICTITVFIILGFTAGNSNPIDFTFNPTGVNVSQLIVGFGFALITQAVWACILTLTGTFEQLFTYVMFITLVFWTAAVASVFTLRKKYPDLPRPYKTWGYPLVPIVFIIATTGIILNTLVEKPVESLAGLGITLIGIPVYFYWKKKIKLRLKSKGNSHAEK